MNELHTYNLIRKRLTPVMTEVTQSLIKELSDENGNISPEVLEMLIYQLVSFPILLALQSPMERSRIRQVVSLAVNGSFTAFENANREFQNAKSTEGHSGDKLVEYNPKDH